MEERIFSRGQIVLKYLKYLLVSSNGRGHGTHSPFVFDFITHVLRGKQANEKTFARIEEFRKKLLNSSGSLAFEDLGAGSSRTLLKKRTISSIARVSLKPPKYAKLLFRIVTHYKPDSILELGTSFGLTTQYLALGSGSAMVITIEGSRQIAGIANQGFLENQCQHIHLRIGDFSQELEQAINRMQGKKLFYVDGNHRYESTMSYFESMMRVSSADDILVFDDIHWSRGMEQAWEEIKQDARVRCTIDLFFIGLVFLKKNFLEKQDFIVRF